MATALLVVGGYVLGSMPWGYWLPLLFRHEVDEHNNGRLTLHLHRQHAHHSGQFFTPYLATAGLVSAALAIFLVLVMRRRKRAAWVVNILLSTPLFALYVLALTQHEYRAHVFNWVSAALTGLFVAALLISRREFDAGRSRVRTSGLTRPPTRSRTTQSIPTV